MTDVTLYAFGDRQIRVFDLDGEPVVAAADLIEGIGLGNVTQATRKIKESERRRLLIAQGEDKRPPTSIIVLTMKGAQALLQSKASTAAENCLAWFEATLMPVARRCT